VRTESTYEKENPRRIYYLSLEFLIGRALNNNTINLLLEPAALRAVERHNLNWHELLDEEPDAGLGNGGLGRLAACFLDSMATMQLPAMGYGLRYEYGIFKQAIGDGWQVEEPDNWLREADPWEVSRSSEPVEVKLNCSFAVHDCTLRTIVGQPSTLIGLPFHRPVVGYGGKTINTLRLWAAAAPKYFDFQKFSSGDFVAALAGTLAAESLTRVLYPDDSASIGQALRFVQEYFLVACSLADLVRRFRRNNRLAGISRSGRDPDARHASGDGDPGADADPARRRRPRLGSGVAGRAAGPRLRQPYAAARSPQKMAARLARIMREGWRM
jgi:starch phosphorylase